MALLDVGPIQNSQADTSSLSDTTNFGGNITFAPLQGGPFDSLAQLALPAIVLLGAYLIVKGAKP